MSKVARRRYGTAQNARPLYAQVSPDVADKIEQIMDRADISKVRAVEAIVRTIDVEDIVEHIAEQGTLPTVVRAVDGITDEPTEPEGMPLKSA